MTGTQQRKILLTGVTRGCGRAMLDRFVEEGHLVVGCGRSADQIARLATMYPSPHRFDSLDIADAEAVDAWAASVLDSGFVPDLLINNAAVMNHTAPLWKVPAAEFQALMDVNVVGTANVIRAFVPAMVERQVGVIVNFSSGWGRTTAPEVAPYCASKFAIEGLTRALAEELPRGMAAIPLNPGIINTEMLRLCWAEGAKSYPTPDRWSHVAVPFLLRLDASDNGQSLSIL